MNTQVFKTIKKFNMLENVDAVVLGVSGGADSMAMLGFFLETKKLYNLEIHVAHLNHMLRKDESFRDENFVKDFCDENDINFHLKTVDIKKEAKKNSLGIEQYARDIRYKFFSEILNKIKTDAIKNIKIATAHNLTDMTETMLFHMIRGTGIRGLRGVAPVDNNIIRPLIECDRKTIEKYLIDNNIKNILDSTNMQNIYTRNKIRNNVLKVFEEINKNYAKNFFSLSRQADEIEDYININAKDLLDASKIDEKNPLLSNILECYDAKTLKKAHNAVLKKAVLLILEKNDIIINEQRIDEITKIIKNDGKINLSKNIFVEVKIGMLYLYIEDTRSDKPYNHKAGLGENFIKSDKKIILKKINSSNFKEINYNDNKVLKNMLNYDIIENKVLYLRSRQEKDSIKLFDTKYTKTIKKLMNERKIPLDKRNDTTILATKDEVLWIEGFGVSKKYMIENGVKNFLEIEIEK